MSFREKPFPLEDCVILSLAQIPSRCTEPFESPGFLVMLSPELSDRSVPAAGPKFRYFGRENLATISVMMMIIGLPPNSCQI